ncbi:MAG: hypothetical protein NTU53_04405 [Planctomycetota bacterium]|nr:hypothetical protein [Planctomycetota bacterium]
MKARENPFSMDRVERFRYRPLDRTWEQIMQTLAELEYRAAIVGPEGSGKSTMLEDLRERLRAIGLHVRCGAVNVNRRRMAKEHWQAMLAELSPRDVILFDGADHLPWWDWMRLRWHARRAGGAGGLIIAVHREGMLPTLLKTRTSVQLLAEMVTELLGRHEPMVEEVFEKHRGNLREAIREMYDWMAER